MLNVVHFFALLQKSLEISVNFQGGGGGFGEGVSRKGLILFKPFVVSVLIVG